MQIPLFKPVIEEGDISAVAEALRSGDLSMGPRTQRFEKAIAEKVGARHCIAVSSGTAALHLSLLAVGVGPGDEVITTPFTYVASVNAILYCGARPVLLDIDPLTWDFDPRKLESRLTNRTKAVLPVHVFGRPCDMESIISFTRAHGLKCVEDSCEALGSYIGDRSAGTFGDAGCFGFFSNKQVATGEGGAIVTDDDAIAAQCNSLRHQGRAFDGVSGYLRLGYNYKFSDLQAALGLHQLQRSNGLEDSRGRIAQWYGQELGGFEAVVLPHPPGPRQKVSWFVYVVRLADRYCSQQRDSVIAQLQRRGIGCSNYFPAIHLQPYHSKLLGTKRGDFPICEQVSDRTIALPFFTAMKQEEVQQVCAELKEAVSRSAG